MASPPVVRPAKPAWASLDAAGSAALLFVAVLLAYVPALRGGFLWDDDAHVTGPGLRSLHGLWRIWFEVGATQQYYPVLHTAFWIEHRLWGDSVLGHHLAGVAFHTAAAGLLVRILRKLAFPAPRLAGLLFALHPVCVESVAWISEQKTTLSAVFYLCAALLYLRFDRTRRAGPYFCAFGFFALAVLTKSVTASLPAALLLVFWWQRGRLGWRRDILPLAPWIAVGAAAGLFTAWVEEKFIGAEGADFAFTALQRLLLAGRAVVFYLGKLFWPANLIFNYPRWTVDSRSVGPYLYLAGVLALLSALLLLARKRRGPLTGFLFFVGTLFPVLGFVNVYPFVFSFVADHFQYLACIGIIVPVAWALDRVAGRIASGTGIRSCILLAVPAVLGTLSWRQCRNYRDADTLNRATLARNPSAWLARYNLAVSIGADPGRTEEAISEYEAVLKLKPNHWAAHSNLGSAFLRMPGRSADAIAEYETALRLRPDFAEAHNNLGMALARVPGRLPEAIAHLRMALRIRPDYDGAHNNLGILLMREPGSLDGAIGEFRAALRTAPDNAEYHYNLANALAAGPGGPAGAVAEYRTALRLNPDSMEAHANLAAAWAQMPGHMSDAVSEYQAAIRVAPGSAQVHAKFGILLSDLPGRVPDAISEFETAVRLKPDFAEAHFCLGVVLLRAGDRRQEAVGHLERALEIQPGFEPARRILERLQGNRPNSPQ